MGGVDVLHPDYSAESLLFYHRVSLDAERKMFLSYQVIRGFPAALSVIESGLLQYQEPQVEGRRPGRLADQLRCEGRQLERQQLPVAVALKGLKQRQLREGGPEQVQEVRFLHPTRTLQFILTILLPH